MALQADPPPVVHTVVFRCEAVVRRLFKQISPSVVRTVVGGKTVFGPGAPAESTERLPPPVKPETMIADFESGLARTNADEILMMSLDSGVQRSTGVMTVVDDGTGNHVLEFMGDLTLRETPEAGVIVPFTRGWVAPVDVNGLSGVKFRFRGGEGTYVVRIQTPDGYWTSELTGDPQWSEKAIAFSALEGPEEVNWSGKDAVSLHVVAKGEGGEVVWFELDDIAFE